MFSTETQANVSVERSFRRQRLQLQPQASLSAKHELGKTANPPRAAPVFRVHTGAETKPQQGQRHDNPQLSHGELLSDTVPVRERLWIFTPLTHSIMSLLFGFMVKLDLGPDEKGMKAWEERFCVPVGSKRRGLNSWFESKVT